MFAYPAMGRLPAALLAQMDSTLVFLAYVAMGPDLAMCSVAGAPFLALMVYAPFLGYLSPSLAGLRRVSCHLLAH